MAATCARSQSLGATQALGGAFSRDIDLDELNRQRLLLFREHYGVTIGAFDTRGKRDALLYADSRTFSPDSSGFIFQADVTPFGGEDPPWETRINLRVGLQYVVFTIQWREPRFRWAGAQCIGQQHAAAVPVDRFLSSHGPAGAPLGGPGKRDPGKRPRRWSSRDSAAE